MQAEIVKNCLEKKEGAVVSRACWAGEAATEAAERMPVPQTAYPCAER